MPRKAPSPLRAVRPGERPPQKRFTVATAATEGSTLDLLIAMRDRIAKEVTSPNCPPRELASLTRRLHELAKDIEAIRLASEEGAGADDSPDEAFTSEAL